jgi:hypothetical protein
VKKSLTIGLAAAALIAGALSLMTVDSSRRAPANVITEAAAAESEPEPVVVRMAQLAPASPLYRLDYERGPRIIHVPQPGERANDRVAARSVNRASVSREEPEVEEDDEVVEAAPQPLMPSSKKKVRVIPMQRQVSAPPPAPDKAPRWKLRSESPPPPPPSGPKRAVLSAPPPSAEGPTPIRPTPRYEAKADAASRFAPPSEPATPSPDAAEPQPPLGYLPPVMPAPPLGYSPPATPLPED